MPLETMPRTGRFSSVMPLPGMKVPSGANTATMPARAFGAPHTTSTGGLPLAISTCTTRRRSALGWGLASTTRAMVKAPSLAAGSSTLSTSSPMADSLSVISASEALVSR